MPKFINGRKTKDKCYVRICDRFGIMNNNYIKRSEIELGTNNILSITEVNVLLDRLQVHRFAKKWSNKFRNPQTDYLELVDHYLADECDEIGFNLDGGVEFSKRYGKAVFELKELEKIIHNVNDLEILGSAIYSRWRYFNHWSNNSEEILEVNHREWFILALDRLAKLSESSPLKFEGEAKMFQLISNDYGYGPLPYPTEEIEQHLTINANGLVEFLAFNFGDGKGSHPSKRSKTISIENLSANRILNAVGEYFGRGYTEIFATDIGDWHLEIINTNDDSYFFKGSLCADLEIDGVNLSELIREQIPLNNLFLFDGNYQTDKVTRLTIDYHRVTEVKSKYLDYKESLSINRATETIEYLQAFDSGSTITQKFQVQGEVKKLLDSLYAESLFENFDDQLPDEIDGSHETKEYKIVIDFEEANQRTITGRYDKNGLPEDWSYFAEVVLKFLTSYGIGEMLDSTVYNKTKRRSDEYIYCSVTFGESYNTYDYLTDDDSIEVGDLVIVPVGKDNHQVVVEVVKIRYYQENKVPYPIDKTKKIIRKYTEEEFE